MFSVQRTCFLSQQQLGGEIADDVGGVAAPEGAMEIVPNKALSLSLSLSLGGDRRRYLQGLQGCRVMANDICRLIETPGWGNSG